MKIQVGRWGNSLAVRVPKDIAERFDLHEGDELDSAVLEAALGASRGEARRRVRQEALEWIAAQRFELPSDYKFDRDEANAR